MTGNKGNMYIQDCSNKLLQKGIVRDCITMCFDICTINIRVSIRVRGLHLVLIFFLLLFSSSDSSHVCFSSVHIVGSLTSKLPSAIAVMVWMMALTLVGLCLAKTAAWRSGWQLHRLLWPCLLLIKPSPKRVCMVASLACKRHGSNSYLVPETLE